MTKEERFFIGKIVTIILGICFVFYGIYGIFENFNYRIHGVESDAVVSEILHQGGTPKGGSSTYIIYKYTTDSGETYKGKDKIEFDIYEIKNIFNLFKSLFTLNFPKNVDEYKKGDHIKILYLENSPEKSKIIGNRSIIVCLLYILIGILFIVFKNKIVKLAG